MTKEELKQEAGENSFRYTLDKPWACEVERKQIMAHFGKGYLAGAEPREKRIAELEAQIEKMKSLNDKIVKSLNDCLDYEWLPAHNGKAKYLYLQTVIDIVNEKFEEIKEK